MYKLLRNLIKGNWSLFSIFIFKRKLSLHNLFLLLPFSPCTRSLSITGDTKTIVLSWFKNQNCYNLALIWTKNAVKNLQKVEFTKIVLLLSTHQRGKCFIRDLDLHHWRPTWLIKDWHAWSETDMPDQRLTFLVRDK